MENIGNQKNDKSTTSEGVVNFTEADAIMKADAILSIIKLEMSGVYKRKLYNSETGEERVLINDTNGKVVFDDTLKIYNSYRELVEVDSENKLYEDLDKNKWN